MVTWPSRRPSPRALRFRAPSDDDPLSKGEFLAGEVLDDFPVEVSLPPGQATGDVGVPLGRGAGADDLKSVPYRILEEQELI